MKSFLFLFTVFTFISCSKEETLMDLERLKNEIKLSQNLSFSNDSDTINFSLGIWMFNNNKKDVNAIANWINVKHNGKTILEPINILWIDYLSKNKTEAITRVTEFLKSNKFILRKGSSTGYFGLFDEFNWIEQYPDTWSDFENPNVINNHGRVFLAHQVLSESKKPVFISSGAFSIESAKHLYISFSDALTQLNEVNNWSLFLENLNIGNIVDVNNYSTFDHKGLKVFVLK